MSAPACSSVPSAASSQTCAWSPRQPPARPSGPVKSTRPAARSRMRTSGRLRERRPAASLPPAVALAPRPRLGIVRASDGSPFRLRRHLVWLAAAGTSSCPNQRAAGASGVLGERSGSQRATRDLRVVGELALGGSLVRRRPWRVPTCLVACPTSTWGGASRSMRREAGKAEAATRPPASRTSAWRGGDAALLKLKAVRAEPALQISRGTGGPEVTQPSPTAGGLGRRREKVSVR